MVINITSKKCFTAFKYVLFLFLGFFSNTLLANQLYPMPTPDEVVAYKEVTNADGNPAKLKLHFFYPPNHDKESKKPAIVFFFGGGWIKGDPNQFYRQSKYLASLGMVAISAEYRTKNKHNTKPREAAKDAKSAMRFVRKNASNYGINSAMIAAGGASAGGQLAALTATSNYFNEFSERNVYNNISERPNALVLFNPVIHNGPKDAENKIEEGFGYSRVKEYWSVFSPMNNLKEDTPPTLILTGDEDEYTPKKTYTAYKDIMDSNNTHCELILYKGEKHGFFNIKAGNKIEIYEDTLDRTVQFLASLGYIPSLNHQLGNQLPHCS